MSDSGLPRSSVLSRSKSRSRSRSNSAKGSKSRSQSRPKSRSRSRSNSTERKKSRPKSGSMSPFRSPSRSQSRDSGPDTSHSHMNDKLNEFKSLCVLVDESKMDMKDLKAFASSLVDEGFISRESLPKITRKTSRLRICRDISNALGMPYFSNPQIPPNFDIQEYIDKYKVPKHFKDPLSGLIMMKPVTLSNGIEYDADTAEKILQMNDPPRDPHTRMPLDPKIVIENNGKKKDISDYLVAKTGFETRDFLNAHARNVEKRSKTGVDAEEIEEVEEIEDEEDEEDEEEEEDEDDEEKEEEVEEPDAAEIDNEEVVQEEREEEIEEKEEGKEEIRQISLCSAMDQALSLREMQVLYSNLILSGLAQLRRHRSRDFNLTKSGLCVATAHAIGISFVPWTEWTEYYIKSSDKTIPIRLRDAFTGSLMGHPVETYNNTVYDLSTIEDMLRDAKAKNIIPYDPVTKQPLLSMLTEVSVPVYYRDSVSIAQENVQWLLTRIGVDAIEFITSRRNQLEINEKQAALRKEQRRIERLLQLKELQQIKGLDISEVDAVSPDVWENAIQHKYTNEEKNDMEQEMKNDVMRWTLGRDDKKWEVCRIYNSRVSKPHKLRELVRLVWFRVHNEDPFQSTLHSDWIKNESLTTLCNYIESQYSQAQYNMLVERIAHKKELDKLKENPNLQQAHHLLRRVLRFARDVLIEENELPTSFVIQYTRSTNDVLSIVEHVNELIEERIQHQPPPMMDVAASEALIDEREREMVTPPTESSSRHVIATALSLLILGTTTIGSVLGALAAVSIPIGLKILKRRDRNKFKSMTGLARSGSPVALERNDALVLRKGLFTT